MNTACDSRKFNTFFTYINYTYRKTPKYPQYGRVWQQQNLLQYFVFQYFSRVGFDV